MKQQVWQLVREITPQVKEYRHEIHQHPELGMNEIQTGALVQRELARIGIPFQANVGKMGVVGLIQGKGAGPCVALRADMDALPIQETTGLPWASQVAGVCHACGHDTHTSMLLGAAEVLWKVRDQFDGTVKLLFQPAEECNPTGGMPFMIADGILENPRIDAAIGLHVAPELKTGKVGYRAGAHSASSNRFYVAISGKAAHGSAPENGVDAIVAAAQVVMGLQTVVSRNVRALDSAVITIGTIKGGDRYNVIPETVTLEGTCRTHKASVTAAIPAMMERVIKGICDSVGCRCEFRFEKGYPSLVADEAITNLVRDGLLDALGEECLHHIPEPGMGGEDFSFLAQRVPSTFLRLGCTPEDVTNPAPAHNGAFNPDEEAFGTGVAALAFGALSTLKKLK